MGKRLIIKGASFITNAIDRISPSTTYYSVIYNLSHCTASNSATSIAAGSTYEVTITAQSGYTLSSVAVRHNGQTVSPTSGNTYRITNVSGNITVTATATADVTTYTVTYDLENATASNNATIVTAGSSYSVTLTPNSGYTISNATVTHNGVEIEPTSGYTYNIPSVSGNILVECVAVEGSVQDIDLSNSILRSDTKRQFIHYPSNNQNYLFSYATSLTTTKVCVVDVSAYVGYDIELSANFGTKTSDAYDGGPAYFHCFASAINTVLPWAGTSSVKNAVTPVELIPYDGGGYKTKTLTVPQGARYLVCTEKSTLIEVVVKNVPKGDFDLTNAILYTDTLRQFIHYPNGSLSNAFQYVTSLTDKRIATVDVSAYVGRTLELYAYDRSNSANYEGGAYWKCFASDISIAAYPWTGTVTIKNALTSVEYIADEGSKTLKTYTLTVPQGARYLVFAAYSNYSSYTLTVKDTE